MAEDIYGNEGCCLGALIAVILYAIYKGVTELIQSLLNIIYGHQKAVVLTIVLIIVVMFLSYKGFFDYLYYEFMDYWDSTINNWRKHKK